MTPIGPTDSLTQPRYSGAATFARLPRIDEVADAEIKIVGVPFDSGVTYRPGARFGPSAIRQASRLLRPYNPAQKIDVFQTVQVADCGDISANPFNIEEAIEAVSNHASQLIAGNSRLITLGGDHTISLPLLRAMHARHGRIALVHFDAHLDTWNTYFGAPYTHGTPFRRAFEEGLLAEESCMHIGIRGPLYGSSDLVEDAGLGFQVITTDMVAEMGPKEVAAQIIRRVGNSPLYLSLDIDVMDPAFAPGTGTPEAGGLSSREVLTIIRALSGLDLVGGDVVEVSPAYDHAEVTSVAASHVVYELITLMAIKMANGS
ncbi:MAG: agmatinase [Acidimicrobiaceae bacterium]|nr:agmatinase [Acidimicrobiaceae bacterium]